MSGKPNQTIKLPSEAPIWISFFVFVALIAGEPDLLDAIIYSLTDGVYAGECETLPTGKDQ